MQLAMQMKGSRLEGAYKKSSLIVQQRIDGHKKPAAQSTIVPGTAKNNNNKKKNQLLDEEDERLLVESRALDKRIRELQICVQYTKMIESIAALEKNVRYGGQVVWYIDSCGVWCCSGDERYYVLLFYM